ncbi:MAG: hypothetical protein HYT70_03220 [Candidatus Aenigmarchaeota archaeon]|nr:hypothetical protein [Candidatus Aenigmarchaeota archaeon]
MKLNTERKLALIYLVLAVAMGLASRYLDTGAAVLSAVVLYSLSMPLIRKLLKERVKTAWYVANTLITYILVWLIVWILAFNFW